jgi:predicted nucleic acid-binding protein
MAFVVDASVAATWMYKDEDHPDAAYAFDLLRAEVALAPAIWWFEVRNLMVTGERRQRFTRDEVEALRKSLAVLPVEIDRDPDEDRVFDLARRHRLTIYDAAYLELALRHRLALASLDRALIAGATAEGVQLIRSA